jgi:hypothetical protein
MALVSLSVQEERYGSKEKCEKHISSAMDAMRPQMGQYPTVEVFMHWVYYTMAARNTPIDAKDAADLISFLRNAESMLISHSSTAFLSQAPQRQSVFQFGTPLHTLLSSGPHPTHVPREDRVWVVKYDSLYEICRTASLLYITSALWDHWISADKCSRFLNGIITDLKEKTRDGESGTETLLWILLENSYHSYRRDPQQAWYVGGLLRVVKELTPELHFQFCELLLSFLMLRSPDLGMSVSKFENALWEYAKESQSFDALSDGYCKS